MIEWDFSGPNGDRINARLYDRDTHTFEAALYDEDDQALLAVRYRRGGGKENPSDPCSPAVIRFIIEEARIPSRGPGQSYQLGSDLAERLARFADVLAAFGESEIRRLRSAHVDKPEAERPPLARYELMDARKGASRLLRLLATPERVS